MQFYLQCLNNSYSELLTRSSRRYIVLSSFYIPAVTAIALYVSSNHQTSQDLKSKNAKTKTWNNTYSLSLSRRFSHLSLKTIKQYYNVFKQTLKINVASGLCVMFYSLHISPQRSPCLFYQNH